MEEVLTEWPKRERGSYSMTGNKGEIEGNSGRKYPGGGSNVV